MKRKLLLSLIILLAASAVVEAQITFEQRLPADVYPFKTSQSGTWYAEWSYSISVSVYRSDFTLYRELHPPYINPGEYGDIYFMSDKLFNTDDKLEYMLFRYDSASNVEGLLVNEDAEILYEFGLVANAYPFITQSAGMNPVLGFRTVDFDLGILVTDLYSLPGTYLPVQNAAGQDVFYPSPNPANNYIKIPYHINSSADALLTIYNTSGAQVEKMILDKNSESTILNVTGFSPGVYIYKYGTTTGKFVVR